MGDFKNRNNEMIRVAEQRLAEARERADAEQRWIDAVQHRLPALTALLGDDDVRFMIHPKAYACDFSVTIEKECTWRGEVRPLDVLVLAALKADDAKPEPVGVFGDGCCTTHLPLQRITEKYSLKPDAATGNALLEMQRYDSHSTTQLSLYVDLGEGLLTRFDVRLETHRSDLPHVQWDYSSKSHNARVTEEYLAYPPSGPLYKAVHLMQFAGTHTGYRGAMIGRRYVQIVKL